MPTPAALKLFIFVGFVWASLVGPFSVVLILDSTGATSPQIGVVMAICSVVSMVFQPMWGLLSDKVGSPRRVLCFCLGGSALFFGSVFFANGFYLIAGLLILDIFFRCGIIALLDSHILLEIKTIPGLQYSHIRMAGSIFFGGLSLIYSGVISNRGIMAIIPISVCIAVFTLFWGLFIAKGRWESVDDKDVGVKRAKPNLKRDVASLIKNKPYMLLLAFGAMSALAVSPLFVFLIEYVSAVGGHHGHVPLIHALRCAVEIPVFILVGALGKKVAAKKLMLTGACFTLVFIVGLLFANSFFWLAISHLAAGAPGFILGLTGRLRYVNETTPESVRSTSITLMGTFEIGLGAIVGNLTAGFVLGAYGIQALTLVSVAAISVALLLLVFIPAKPAR